MTKNSFAAKFDESKYKEASELARNVEIGWTEFELFGITYNLMTTPSENCDGSQNGEAAEYRAWEKYRWDIYLWEDLKEKIQRPLLFHEIIEIYNKVHTRMGDPQAHSAAMPLEKRFCNEFLTKEELEEYLDFKEKQGYYGFHLVDDMQETKSG